MDFRGKAMNVALALLCLNPMANAQNITLRMSNVTVKQAMDELKSKSGYSFVFSSQDVDTHKNITVESDNQPLGHVISQIVAEGLAYTIEGKTIILRKATAGLVQQQNNKRITGVVKDANGEPVIGANIVVKGTTNGTITDMDGNFVLDVPADAVLHVSYIGYSDKEIPVGNQTVLTVSLAEDSRALEEVVVIGYGTARKIDLTGSTSSLGGEKLRVKSSPQLSTQMQGQMAGVQITRTSGDPSAGSSIRVRGVTTLSTNDPLVIVDGVPGSLMDIAPEDVKDIQVLKDAASAAIYGSRAAAGVILVTTNRAKDKEFHLSYNMEYGIDKATTVPKFANAVQWIQGYNELTYNDGASSPYSSYSEDFLNSYMQNRLTDPDRYPDTDFMGLGLKNHTNHQRHSLSLTGGTDKLKTNFSLNYYDADALYRNKSYERINVRSNNDYQINSWIHANVDVNLMYAKSLAPHSLEGSSMGDLMYRSPIYNVYWSDGRYADGKDGDNPIALNQLGGQNKIENFKVGGKFQLDITPVKNLVLTAIAAPTYTFTKGKDHKTRYDVYRITGETIPGTGYANTSLAETRNDTRSLTMQFYANYNFKIDRHSIGVMAGYEDYSYEWENEGASRLNYNLNNFPYLNLGPEDFQYNSGTAGHNAYRSVFGRVMYSWADRYMLQANIRSDGSSRFASGHRWGTFPSVSAGWVISEESWFNKKTINYLKLRGSIGQLGNERIGSEFPYQARLSFGSGFIPNAASGGGQMLSKRPTNLIMLSAH